jgi:hypothetical protein
VKYLIFFWLHLFAVFENFWCTLSRQNGLPTECGTRIIGYHPCYPSLFPLRTICAGVRIWRLILRPVSRDPHVGGPLIYLTVSTLVRACVSYLPKGDHIFTRFECFAWKFPNNSTGTVVPQLNNGNVGISTYICIYCSDILLRLLVSVHVSWCYFWVSIYRISNLDGPLGRTVADR